MDCRQVITVSDDCRFMTYMNGCNEANIYPPLTLQNNEDFIVIKGSPSPAQISISKFDFDVDLDGQTYTDIDEFIAEILLKINCVNDTLLPPGGGINGIASIEGINFISASPPAGIWTTVQLGATAIDRIVFVNVENRSGAQRRAGVRATSSVSSETDAVRRNNTTSFLVQADSNGDIQIMATGDNLAFYHRQTIITQ